MSWKVGREKGVRRIVTKLTYALVGQSLARGGGGSKMEEFGGWILFEELGRWGDEVDFRIGSFGVSRGDGEVGRS
jgi:hypothetical protein